LSSRFGTVVFPHFAAGGGWTTQLVLVNPTDSLLTGTVAMDDAYTYSIPPRSAVKISSTHNGVSPQVGNIAIVPAPGAPDPAASTIFSYAVNGTTITESGVTTNAVAQSFRIFAEFDASQSLQTGVAIANTTLAPADLQFELEDINGQPTGYAGSTTVAASGHLSLFLNQIPSFQNLPASFRGVLRVTSNSPITAIGVRARYNERRDLLVSTTPAIGIGAGSTAQELVFPHIAIGDGYTTEFILMNPNGGLFSGTATGSISFTTQTGSELTLNLERPVQ
jgi:hypothetical protein